MPGFWIGASSFADFAGIESCGSFKRERTRSRLPDSRIPLTSAAMAQVYDVVTGDYASGRAAPSISKVTRRIRRPPSIPQRRIHATGARTVRAAPAAGMARLGEIVIRADECHGGGGLVVPIEHGTRDCRQPGDHAAVDIGEPGLSGALYCAGKFRGRSIRCPSAPGPRRSLRQERHHHGAGGGA